jgi:K+-transporting ATPase c subunit
VDTYAAYLHCVGIDTSGSFTAAQLQAAATDPDHNCLSTGATTTPIPIDLATGDFTSFDPDISVAAALAQVDMVAAARGLDPARVHAIVEANITGRVLWIFGESDVNVLQLNIAMNNAFGAPPALG